MDPYRLLSRSTKAARGGTNKSDKDAPPSGRVARPQLFSAQSEPSRNSLGKRKRTPGPIADDDQHGEHFDFFNHDSAETGSSTARKTPTTAIDPGFSGNDQESLRRLSADERKQLLKQHKVKAVQLSAKTLTKHSKSRKAKDGSADKSRLALFPSPLLSLRDLRPRFGISQRLIENILDQGYEAPTEVQLAAIPLLLENAIEGLADTAENVAPSVNGLPQIDLLTVAPTGSGKTLAFMIPLLHSLISRRQGTAPITRQTSAIVLAPTKELASQITNEGRKLAKNTGLTISLMRKGMRLPSRANNGNVHESQADDGEDDTLDLTGTATKADILVSTPGVLQNIISDCDSPLWQVHYLILDEADVLLDPMFREQTLATWDSLAEPDLRVSMWSATMGSNIEGLVAETITRRAKRLQVDAGIEVPEVPIVRLVVGLKDSAVPNVSHKMIYAATEKGKLMGLRQLLHPTSSAADSGPGLRPPFLIFTQTVERAIALSSELVYDIPAEAGGSGRIAVLHSDLSDAARDSIMSRFRKSEIWVLITTDLLSRGVDFRGVNGVVNYDIPTSSAAYVHRIGRTGRAGRDGGVAITLYSKEDIPYLKHVANIVATAQKQEGGDGGVQQWLLDALPKLNKNEKKNLKKRGIESRTISGQRKDPKAARRARISTKPGFIRRVENNRKGAILGTQRRMAADAGSDDGEQTDFAGFD